MIIANVKFPEGTVAGAYKLAVAAKPDYDAVRFDSQKINWNLKDVDVSSTFRDSLFITWLITRFVA